MAYKPKPGDVVVGADGCVYSFRRDDYWIDGGWSPDTDSDASDRVDDGEIEFPLTLLVRNGKPVSPS